MKLSRLSVANYYGPILVLIMLLLFGCSSTEILELEPEVSKSVSPTHASVGSVEKIPFIGGIPVHRYTLKNGLKLLILEDHSSPTFAYQTWFEIGSRNEAPGRTGLAHFFEHMMFKETTHMKDGEFDRILESAGVEGENAFTSHDYTAYVQELPKGNLKLIAQAESDRMVNLVISKTSYDTEKEVVQNERRYRNENSPDGLMYQELFTLAFQKHPYRWPVAGYEKDLEHMTPKDAEDFYHSHYSPNRATVVIVGDVVPEEVLATIIQYYGELPIKTLPESSLPQEPEQIEPRSKKLKLNIQVEKLKMAYPIPGTGHKDRPYLEVIQSILTGGKSSRLHQALVNTGIATSVDSDEIETRDPGLFVIAANMQRKRKAKEAEAIIQSELRKLALQPVSESELTRAKNRVDFEFYEGLRSNSSKALFLGQNQTQLGDFATALELHRKVQRVTTADVLATARKYFNHDRKNVVIGVKK